RERGGQTGAPGPPAGGGTRGGALGRGGGSSRGGGARPLGAGGDAAQERPPGARIPRQPAGSAGGGGGRRLQSPGGGGDGAAGRPPGLPGPPDPEDRDGGARGLCACPVRAGWGRGRAVNGSLPPPGGPGPLRRPPEPQDARATRGKTRENGGVAPPL